MNNRHFHYFQHVPFEGLGCIEDWIIDKGYKLSSTNFFENAKLPNLDELDCLIVMGGPMGIYDYGKYPWLKEEKEFIKAAISANKKVIGICLGAQLIADVLGAEVYPNQEKEIGWLNLYKESEHPILSDFDKEFTAFHWHGDTFDLPKNSKRLFHSTVCKNQAYLYNEKVLGLQFHFEATESSVAEIVKNCADELIPAPYVQSAESILVEKRYFQANNERMFKLLDYLDQI
ncbi:type 1 glutamine amidotransferase [Sediminitomix flava]|uniref:GMP synthase-like glutamine amidotransferase n=1 Tax=Sediminitomix flava TaxID=379075 RepID=A0A315ZB32_SEDFL|nr:type 1 glutamine amidotransferase [Sediminitomix flava]PWJ42796.1 GMP synthase-like glutamine amidotransferase [Sediminitomix flava]